MDFKKGVLLGAVSLSALMLSSCVGDESLSGSEEQALAAAPGAAPTCAGPKVLVCHIPPGNPANAHAICVGAPAVKAHLAHGDVLGACGGVDGGSVDAGSVVPATDAGAICGGVSAACSSSAQCCGGLVCAEGEKVCLPQIQ